MKQRLLELLQEEKEIKLKGGLYHQTQVKLAYNSNRIEGSRLEDEFHYNFEMIHPFQDGNGRVGRIIMFKECLKNDLMPFIIEDEQKQFYYRGLNEYKQEKGYLIDTCLSAQDQYEKMTSYFFPELTQSLKAKAETK